MRWIAVLGLGAAFALALTFTLSSDAEAKKRSGKAKACAATNMITGKKASWKCGGAEKCCYDAIMSKGTCAPAGSMCL